MIRQTQIAQMIDTTTDKAQYDECAKKLLSFKAIDAWILKKCTKEFSGYSIPYICEHCLKGDAEVSSKAVHQDQLDRDGRLNGDERIDPLNSEASAIMEQTVYYDIRFKATVPGGDERVQLIINLEIQKNDHPGYPLVMRGFYYCARMISEQYGTVFSNEHFEKMQKVYSIWICPDPAKKRKNGIFKYHTVEETIYGKPYVSPESYDLMEVVILNLGDTDKSSGYDILDLMNTLFSMDMSPAEKKRRLSQVYGIETTVEMEEEVVKMCNLSSAIEEKGIEKGIEEGIKQNSIKTAEMMIQDNEPVSKIMKYTTLSIETLQEIAARLGKNL